MRNIFSSYFGLGLKFNLDVFS